jgi:nucleotide sugar dehydrogenase
MKIQIVGVGVVGTAQAYLASQLGNEVIGFDHHKTTSEYAKMVKELERDVDLTFVTVPEAVVDEVVHNLVRKRVKGIYVIKSSVPPKTTQRLMDRHDIHICHNPEFLREQTSLIDVMHPTVVIIGQCCPEHGEIMREFYRPLGAPIVITQPTVSETVKLTLNSYLATLISFWNEINEVSGALGLSTKEVANLVKLNSRVSAYGTEFFGSPFGGKCLPKDLEQVIQFARQSGINPQMLEAVQEYNRTLNALPL